MKRIMSVFLALAIAAPGLTGCASKYGEQKTAVNYYPACYAPIQDLRDREHDVAKGTAVGGIVGALGGALVGLLATGKAEGAVMGAAVGGAGGLVAGNIYASKQHQADDNVRLASYLQDLDGDISNLDVAGAAAQTSLKCYNQQFQALLAAIKSRAITPQAAQARFAEIMSGREEASNILGEVVTNARQLSQQYEQAFVQEERQLDAPRKAPQSVAAKQAKKRTINRGREKAKELVKRERQWTEVRNTAKQDTAQQTQTFNTAYNEIVGTVTNATI